MKHKAQDIIEFVVNKYGYTKKAEEFNISEWYGFEKDDGSRIRAKYISAYTQKEEFNVNQGGLSEGEKAIVILNFDNGLFVYDIESFEEKMIVIKINENRLEVKRGKAKKNDSHYEIDTTVLESIKMANDTIYGIIQRVSDVHEVDDKAIKKLFTDNMNCGYCGVSQEQIDDMDEICKKSNDYGLTIRPRGYKMEIDQIIAGKGYVEGNMIMSCYWCNNAKTDTFSQKEFTKIAEGIREVWNMRFEAYGLPHRLPTL